MRDQRIGGLPLLISNLSSLLSPHSVEDLEVFAWLEADGFAGGDADFGAGAGVAAYAGFAGLDGEDTEAAEFDAIRGAKGMLHSLEDGVDGCFCLGAGEAGALDYALDEILLDQLRSPSCAVGSSRMRRATAVSLHCDGRKGVLGCQIF